MAGTWPKRARRPVPTSSAAMASRVHALTTAAAAAGESQLERSMSYMVPLAALTLAVTAALTLILMPRLDAPLPMVVTASQSVLVALGIGAALGRHGRPGERQTGAAPQDCTAGRWASSDSSIAERQWRELNLIIKTTARILKAAVAAITDRIVAAPSGLRRRTGPDSQRRHCTANRNLCADSHGHVSSAHRRGNGPAGGHGHCHSRRPLLLPRTSRRRQSRRPRSPRPLSREHGRLRGLHVRCVGRLGGHLHGRGAAC